MIRVRSVGDTTGTYYLGDPAREVRDLGENVGMARWMGSAAQPLGLEGAVGSNQFTAVLQGRPIRGSLIVSPRRTRCAIDVIFAAPKAVSLLFASPDPVVARSVVTAHREGIHAALTYLEQRSIAIRRTAADGEIELRPATGIVAAEFVHGVSRSGDPHLHSHVVIANFAHDGIDGFGSIDQRGIRAHARAADALYRSVLRHEVGATLGVQWWRADTGGDRIVGINQSDEIAASGRAAQVRSGDSARPEKVFHSRSECLTTWRTRALRAPMLDRDGVVMAPKGFIDEHRFESIIHRGAVSAKTVVEAWADGSPHGIRPEVVSEALRRLGGNLGHGVSERELAPRLVVASPLARRVLGPRPTTLNALDRWWSAERGIEFRSLDGLRERIGRTNQSQGHVRDFR